jgi:hypothetical protein
LHLDEGPSRFITTFISISARTANIPMLASHWSGLRIESGYLITAGGAEVLHDTL